VRLYDEARLAALPLGHPLAGGDQVTQAEIAGERYLRLFAPVPVPGPDGSRPRLRSVEEKLEYVAGGHGIIVLPESATRLYQRPDVVYVPVADAGRDTVYLACEAHRRAPLVTGFVRTAQRTSGVETIGAAGQKTPPLPV
jgi:DNA-binding transcriptional LysR family regulator